MTLACTLDYTSGFPQIKLRLDLNPLLRAVRDKIYWACFGLVFEAPVAYLSRESWQLSLGADEEPVADVNIPPASEEDNPQDFQTIFNWPESVEIPANHFNIEGGVMEQLEQQVNCSLLIKTFADNLLTPMSSKMSMSFFLQSKRN